MGQEENKKKKLITLGILTIIAIGGISFLYFSITKDNLVVMYEDCADLYKGKRYGECIICFNDYVINCDKKGKDINSRVYEMRGKSYFEKKKYKEAIKDFSSYIKRDKTPTSRTIYYYRGRAYDQLGNINKAKADIKKACDYEYEDACDYEYIDRIAVGGGALKNLSVPQLIKSGRDSLEKNSFKEATEFFTRAIELNPKRKDAYLLRGLSYRKQRNYERALEDYKKIIKLDPGYAKAYNNRGVVYWKKGEEYYKDALKDYTKAIELNKEDHIAYNNRAVIYYEMGKYNNAKKDYDMAIKLKPDFKESYWNRGINYLKLNLQEKAKEDFRKACALKMKDACIEEKRR